ncbi:uncharacterized protein LOC108820157 isoform X2 [Raphanus sativus]|uniref:Uncharacterized protein LOC108820157 isoform X2 n=1 Tax=Raphanus sativus TaxID=3726 RepID=A0A9W3BZ63_RAPSA|nr:uncharacterized protein LOC108820157 isoform X2 [Raphanus sativus]
MEKQEVSIHEHPLLPVTRFVDGHCKGCYVLDYMYGGYCCNELGCGAMFHKECGEALQEINHSSHPDHPLKLIIDDKYYACSLCRRYGSPLVYSCSVCDFKLDLDCAARSPQLSTLSKPRLHEHPLELCPSSKFVDHNTSPGICEMCDGQHNDIHYMCVQCKLYFHKESVTFFTEACHTSHPKHSLKYREAEAAPTYADKECILCKKAFSLEFYHCDVCNFSICKECMKNPPPVDIVSLTTHEHQLHLVPRLIEFTCNACGTTGDRSPYFCLQCNFMIHWECIDLPRVIYINRHDHCISYTPRLGHGEWKCIVCRRKVDGFYGAYSCSKCPTFAVHARCATNKKVWGMVEREGTPEEEEEIAPFEVIDDTTIKHFLHDHNLRISKDGAILHESILCRACSFQICSEPFYSCEECSFTLHTKCTKLPRMKRHVCSNLPLTLQIDTEEISTSFCKLCLQSFTGFRYVNALGGSYCMCIDVRCGSLSEPFVHGSHPHPLYFYMGNQKIHMSCSGCKRRLAKYLVCEECDFILCFVCAFLPQKVMRHRYDDHPLYLSYGERSVDGKYWCEACETKLNPEEWFYTCNECGVVLHISCTLGEFTYTTPGSGGVVPNTSVSRPICTRCSKRCIFPSIIKSSEDGFVKYLCSRMCLTSSRDATYD